MGNKSRASGRVDRAEQILQGLAASLEELIDLAMELKSKEQQFGYARRLLALAQKDSRVQGMPALQAKLRQQCALCTYKDPDLPDRQRFDDAIRILQAGDNLETTTDQETLGIAGAIYKNRWHSLSQRQDLERSLSYYRRGYTQGISGDQGYTAINTAFVLDLLADEESTRNARPESESTATARIEEAKTIRQEIVVVLTQMQVADSRFKNDWWTQITLAEAYFGLERYPDARPALASAAALPNIAEWEYESTARQLASLARLLMRRAKKEFDLEGSEPWRELEQFLADRTPGITGIFLGKVGLALSGGGFRASLFHIGVLAKLAEFDMLRHVDVLSCVSGGSIVGAHYYLKVRQLLESVPQKDITRESYIHLIHDLEQEFLDGVQKNIRTRVIGDFKANLKMAFLADYSRTERVGELYEEHLFQQAQKKSKHPGLRIWLNRLFIAPFGEPEGFRPKYHNWRRSAKVPMLVLNATTLNTGHNWQFTASWMGEPPASANGIDANYRFRRMYYSEAPKGYRRIRLGYAVAASACVPGIFDPLSFPNLYPDNTVRLVDGGVHDNQGASALLEQGCTVLLVSDASGQMGEILEPEKDVIHVPLRTNSILQARIRLAEYDDLDARLQSSLLKGMMFLHLKKELTGKTVNWIDCKESPDTSAGVPSNATSYGILKEVQKRLAAIRTDLDSFNDTEAFALMTSGYRMTERLFPAALPNYKIPPPPPKPWRFLKIEPMMADTVPQPVGYKDFTRLLDVAKKGLFKIWILDSRLQRVAKGLLVLGVMVALFAFIYFRDDVMIHLTLGNLGLALGSAIGILGVAKYIGPKAAKWLSRVGTPKRIQSELWRIPVFVVIAFAGFILAAVHIRFFDRRYLKRGSLG